MRTLGRLHREQVMEANGIVLIIFILYLHVWCNKTVAKNVLRKKNVSNSFTSEQLVLSFYILLLHLCLDMHI